MMFYHGNYGAIALCMVSVFYRWWSSIDHPGCSSIFHTDLKQKTMVFEAVKITYIFLLHNIFTRYIGSSTKDIMDILIVGNGWITAADVYEEKNLQEPLDKSQPINVIFNIIDDGIQCAIEANILFLMEKVLQMDYHSVRFYGIYTYACKEWCREPSAEKHGPLSKKIALEYNKLLLFTGHQPMQCDLIMRWCSSNLVQWVLQSKDMLLIVTKLLFYSPLSSPPAVRLLSEGYSASWPFQQHRLLRLRTGSYAHLGVFCLCLIILIPRHLSTESSTHLNVTHLQCS